MASSGVHLNHGAEILGWLTRIESIKISLYVHIHIYELDPIHLWSGGNTSVLCTHLVIKWFWKYMFYKWFSSDSPMAQGLLLLLLF